eukprot:3428897-Prymnesium_polylepis.1
MRATRPARHSHARGGPLAAATETGRLGQGPAGSVWEAPLTVRYALHPPLDAACRRGRVWWRETAARRTAGRRPQ